MRITDKEIKDFRELKGMGMTSVVGEYTPSEFWDALNEIERLRRTLTGIRDSNWKTWDDGFNTIEEFERWVKVRCNHVLNGGA